MAGTIDEAATGFANLAIISTARISYIEFLSIYHNLHIEKGFLNYLKLLEQDQSLDIFYSTRLIHAEITLQ